MKQVFDIFMVNGSKEHNKDWTICEDIFEVIAPKSHANIKVQQDVLKFK